MIRFFISFYRFIKAIIIIIYYGSFSSLYKEKKISLWFRCIIFCLRGHHNRGGLSKALEKLGPAYIKLGQFLATRPDILPPSLCDELFTLQDKVSSFPQNIAIDTIENSFNTKIDSLFSDFSAPIATASIAQVHSAILKENGQKVAIKILRPDIQKNFDRNIQTFKTITSVFHFLLPSVKRLKLPTVIHVFSEWVSYELNLTMEAAAISEYAELNKEHPHIITPSIYWEYTTNDILTMQFLEGTPLTNKKSWTKNIISPKEIARQLMTLFLYNATYQGYFHGDFHQGNIIISPNGKIGLVDFGIMGRLDQSSRSYLAQILYGFVIRDYYMIAKLHFDAGYVDNTQDIYRFSQSLRAIGEPLFKKTAGEISIGHVLAALFDITKKFNMETRPELILLQKNMISVEGVCGMLDPDFNIWDVAHPVLKEWIKDHLSIQKKIEYYIKKIIDKIPEYL